MCEVSSLYVKLKISYCVEIVKSLKSKFDLFDPKIKRGRPQVIVNTCVKYHQCMPQGNGVMQT